MDNLKKNQLLLVIFWPSHGCTFRSGPSTGKMRWCIPIWQWFAWPPSRSSWSCLGTMRGQLTRTSSGKRRKSTGRYPAKRMGGEPSWCLSLPGTPGRRCGVKLVHCASKEISLWWQSKHFRLEQQPKINHSLLDINCIGRFTTGLCKQWRRQQPRRRRSFLSFWLFFLFKRTVSPDKNNLKVV